jgi:ribosome-binding protein aMBF1 (putative translation factor)
MSDLKKYISNRKTIDSDFSENYEDGYQSFKIGVLLRQAREASGLTQEEIAERLHTKKSAISRIENHSEDIKLSTLEKFASALGRKIEVSIVQNN